MKILIVMGGFFPGQKYGGPPVSVNNFCSLFREDECYIVTKNHDKDESVPYEGIDSGIWIKRDNCYVKYVNDENYKKSEFEKVILEIKTRYTVSPRAIPKLCFTLFRTGKTVFFKGYVSS